MEYMLLFYEDEATFRQRLDPAAAPGYWGAWSAYVGAIHGADIVKHGNGLQPPHSATTVRLRGGQRQVQDGPFADTREQLGGYFVIDVPTLDDALAWAARSPNAAVGGTEVRPVLPPPPNMPLA